MAAKLTRLTHKIAIQLHLVAESLTMCKSRCRRPARKLLVTPSYTHTHTHTHIYTYKQVYVSWIMPSGLFRFRIHFCNYRSI